MQAYVESPIYARTNGYLKKWYHDIGSRIRQGDLLADIDTPEVDQQLSQARADLNTSQANANLSKITAARFQNSSKPTGVSKQEVDNAVGDLEAKVANVKSAEANVRRLEELDPSSTFMLPLAGSSLGRNVDTGTLIKRRQRGAVAATLRSRADRSHSRVCKRAGSLCALNSRGARRFSGAYAISQPEIYRQGGAHRGVHRPRHANPAHRSGRANHAGALLPGGYSQAHLQVKVTGARLAVSVNGVAVPVGRPARGGGGCQSSSAPRAITVGRD